MAQNPAKHKGDGSLGSSSNHGSGVTVSNHSHGFSNSMRGGSTGRRDSVVRSTCSGFNSNDSRCGITQKSWDCEWRYLGPFRTLG